VSGEVFFRCNIGTLEPFALQLQSASQSPFVRGTSHHHLSPPTMKVVLHHNR